MEYEPPYLTFLIIWINNRGCKRTCGLAMETREDEDSTPVRGVLYEPAALD
jgi:hypothetical protein